jgi:hypothetical protein
MLKMNAALTPLLERGINIFGDESNLTGPANELEFFRFGLRSHQYKDRAAIWRRNSYPAVTGFEADIGDQPESKPVQVELQASLLVANENGALENSQVRVLPIQPRSGRVNPTG